jgi:hypothetical protein
MEQDTNQQGSKTLEIPLSRSVSEELETDADLGTEAEDTEFSACIGDQPLGLKLRDVFTKLNKDVPVECALYKRFDVWLIPHRFSLVRKRGLAEPVAVGLEIEYETKDQTCSVISLIPGPRFQDHGQICLENSYSGAVDAGGDFTKCLENFNTGTALKLGALSFGITAKGRVAFSFHATISTPIISACGEGSSRCEWRFDRYDQPLFGKTIETWAALVLPKRKKELAYTLRFYYLKRTLFFPTRKEGQPIRIVCQLTT